MMTAPLIYFSSQSGNCHRFVEKLGLPATRMAQENPLQNDNNLTATQPFVLLLPTYGGGGTRGAVPRPVIQFLNNIVNRNYLRGVIAAGNTNFGEAYAIAGDIISAKCNVPYLYRFELLGTSEDVERVRLGLDRFWQQQKALTS